MRYLILADIHANIEALDACLADARGRKYDRTLVLGDLVGYGADPDAVIDRVRALEPHAIVRGNHDKAACGIEAPEDFNSVAKSAALWTHDIIAPDHREWLAGLPQGPIQVDDLMEICHGSPFDEDAYIFDELDALRALKAAKRPLCLFGHTHCPIAFDLSADTLERVSYLLGIYKALQLLFTQPSQADAWVRKPNAAFGGRSALDHALGGKVVDLASVRSYLDAVRGGGG